MNVCSLIGELTVYDPAKDVCKKKSKVSYITGHDVTVCYRGIINLYSRLCYGAKFKPTNSCNCVLYKKTYSKNYKEKILEKGSKNIYLDRLSSFAKHLISYNDKIKIYSPLDVYEEYLEEFFYFITKNHIAISCTVRYFIIFYFILTVLHAI